MSKIVRKAHVNGRTVEFTLSVNGEVCKRYENDRVPSVADGQTALNCGTTLSALHQELTEGGEDGR